MDPLLAHDQLATLGLESDAQRHAEHERTKADCRTRWRRGRPPVGEEALDDRHFPGRATVQGDVLVQERVVTPLAEHATDDHGLPPEGRERLCIEVKQLRNL